MHIQKEHVYVYSACSHTHTQWGISIVQNGSFITIALPIDLQALLFFIERQRQNVFSMTTAGGVV